MNYWLKRTALFIVLIGLAIIIYNWDQEKTVNSNEEIESNFSKVKNEKSKEVPKAVVKLPTSSKGTIESNINVTPVKNQDNDIQKQEDESNEDLYKMQKQEKAIQIDVNQIMEKAQSIIDESDENNKELKNKKKHPTSTDNKIQKLQQHIERIRKNINDR